MIIGIMCGILLACFACGKSEPLLVFASNSLREVFTELQPAAEKVCGRSIAYTFATAGVLRQQIEGGAIADVFVPSSEHDMDILEEKGALAEGTRSVILKNALTVIGQPGSAHVFGRAALRDLLDAAPKFAMGDPRLVPAGRYADAVIPWLELTRSTNGRILLGNPVRQVVEFVEAGTAQYGFVFGSDAHLSDGRGKSSLVYQFSDAELNGEPIIYPAAVLGNAPQKGPARAFVKFLGSAEAKKVFIKAGFSIS
jgi:molybdate transport system substrate-binding protein